jgi:hypothetical protein
LRQPGRSAETTARFGRPAQFGQVA